MLFRLRMQIHGRTSIVRENMHMFIGSLCIESSVELASSVRITAMANRRAKPELENDVVYSLVHSGCIVQKDLLLNSEH